MTLKALVVTETAASTATIAASSAHIVSCLTVNLDFSIQKTPFMTVATKGAVFHYYPLMAADADTAPQILSLSAGVFRLQATSHPVTLYALFLL